MHLSTAARAWRELEGGGGGKVYRGTKTLTIFIIITFCMHAIAEDRPLSFNKINNNNNIMFNDPL